MDKEHLPKGGENNTENPQQGGKNHNPSADGVYDFQRPYEPLLGMALVSACSQCDRKLSL